MAFALQRPYIPIPVLYVAGTKNEIFFKIFLRNTR
jgi:hypothetical protein